MRPAKGMPSRADLGSPVRRVEEHLDHYCLNESLGIESPTSEAIATWAWNHLRDRGLRVAAVLIEETCTSVLSHN
jgi:6-pyruvoyl-tetrahydropterin synthase